MKKYVYLFNEGSSDMHQLLGGKGANLAEMTNLNIPVPLGFTISTEACVYFMKHKQFPKKLKQEVLGALDILEKKINKKFGCHKKPMLLSVRSGARTSMPGMMETVLNIGLNKKTIIGLINQTNNKPFVYDSYRRLLTMYADVVMEKSNNLNLDVRHKLDLELENVKKINNLKNDSELSENDLIKLCKLYENKILAIIGQKFPQSAEEQLWKSIEAVFRSWNGERAKHYRKIENIPDSWGTAVNVQCMVFGNMGKSSATGVAFTRNPATGDNIFFGEWLPNAQGEDVVAGIRTPFQITGGKNSLEILMPEIYKQLFKIQKKLETHYKDMQDIEFTVEHNKLWLLQTRSGKRNGTAAIKIAIDLLKKKIINHKTFFQRINAKHMNEMLLPTIDNKEIKNNKSIASGLPAGPGAASGQIVFDADEAEKLFKKGLKVILVTEETSPEDIHGMHVANAILTARGGMTSHAALVARGWGKCCIVGCHKLVINKKKNECTINNKIYKKLSWFTLNGTSGEIFDKKINLYKPSFNTNTLFIDLMNIFNKYNRILIRTNADNPQDTKQAKLMGAKGIGLCRTEHMFFNPKRIHEVRKMIIAEDKKYKIEALNNLLKYQTNDFYNIFKEIAPYPVTIRLLDPPLHEFLPHNKNQISELSLDLNINIKSIRKRIESLKETNPMLGHRGCRLGITFPELTTMQTKAILKAANKINQRGGKIIPEIMIPLIGSLEEFLNQKSIIDIAAKEFNENLKTPVKYLIGTMIELPRACLIADKIAPHADFFSFGTNDLTQTTFGLSRDDVGSFFPNYFKQNILTNDPFTTIDREGVGALVEMAVLKIRKINPKIKIGVCGEHGGDPDSIRFFNKLNFDYVSCSPFRVPIAYLAIAQNNC